MYYLYRQTDNTYESTICKTIYPIKKKTNTYKSLGHSKIFKELDEDIRVNDVSGR